MTQYWDTLSEERKQKTLELARIKRLIARDKAIESLGGKCIHCGFTDKRALQFDHTNGDGSTDRKEIKSALARYNRIISGQDRKKYQLLCANCNWIKRVEKDESFHGTPRQNTEVFVRKQRPLLFKDHTEYEQKKKEKAYKIKLKKQQEAQKKSIITQEKNILSHPKLLLSKLPHEVATALRQKYCNLQ
jgi:hypothetical protein